MADNIVNFNNYKEERRKLLESVAYKGEIQVPNIQRNKEEKEQERYIVPKSNREGVTKKQTKKSKLKLIRNGFIGVGLIGLVAFGSIKAYSEYKDNQNTLTLEQALENGETLENLGINEEIAREIDELNVKINGELTNQEIINLAEDITNLQFKVGKTKIADILDVDVSDVRFNPDKDDLGASVSVKDKGTYFKNNVTNMIFGEKTIPKEIQDYIADIVTMQEIEEDVLQGDFDREKLLKMYKKMINKTSKFAAGELAVDEKGNITIEKTKVSEIEKEKTEEEQGLERE